LRKHSVADRNCDPFPIPLREHKPALLKKFGFSAEKIVAAAKSQVAKHQAQG
jgi:hypothetical protein